MSDKEKKSPTNPKQEKADVKNKSKMKLWIRETKAELKKVHWPSKKQTIGHTTTVIGCVLAVGVFIWMFDFLASNVIQALISLT